MKNKILYIPALLLLMLACTSEPDFSYVPSISFNSIQLLTTEKQGLLGISKKDSVIITVDFQDGDGDLGFTPEELAKLKKTTGEVYKLLLWMFWYLKTENL